MLGAHGIIVPVLLPLACAVMLLLLRRAPLALHRGVSLGATFLLLALALDLFIRSQQGIIVYQVGNWAAPFGITLVLDRLSALMLLLGSVLAMAALLYAAGGADREGPAFHTLFQFQLVGINGAFLTGDLFNLFVFFEILLIASYGLLLHGGGPCRIGAAVHYVTINLTASALFLVALGLVYAATGTLNMAGFAAVAGGLSGQGATLLAAGSTLLMVVFAVKAALVPLHPWLPQAYGSAVAPVAALFAIMTKVGGYGILRILYLTGERLVEDLGLWLSMLSVLTVAVGAAGVAGSRDLRRLTAYLVIFSVGTLMVGGSSGSAEGIAAALYYLVHTTLVTAGLFLLTDIIVRQRGENGSDLRSGVALTQPGTLGVLFILGGAAIAGIPPTSGFIGKLSILTAVLPSAHGGLIWAVLLVSSALVIIALCRAGSVLFWKSRDVAVPAPRPAGLLPLAATGMLLSGALVLAVAAGPLNRYAEGTAADVLNTDRYVNAVLGTGGGR